MRGRTEIATIGITLIGAISLSIVGIGIVRTVLLTLLCGVGLVVWAGARSRPHREVKVRRTVEHVQPHTVIVQHLGEGSRPAWR